MADSDSVGDNYSDKKLTVPQIPRCMQVPSVLNGLISYEESLRKYKHYRRSGHVFIWTPLEECSPFGALKAAVMMHLRFDGSLGFPGGLVKRNEDLLVGLQRELVEEIGWHSDLDPLNWEDYYSTQVHHEKKLVCHFFIKQLPKEDYIDLEKRCLLAPEYGSEVLGTFRVPLYVMDKRCGGLPTFLNNAFAGTAKHQLLLALNHIKILTEGEIEEVMTLRLNTQSSVRKY